jgi:uncharacterized protein YjiS (DUF1127 family)
MSASNSIESSAGRIAAGSLRAPLGMMMRGVRHAMAVAWRNHKTRRVLGEMDERMLSDLGISRAQASFEASRWMWD